jgi:hypothetical protein
VFVCMSVVTNRARQGGQGRHSPTRPAGGPQQPSGWSSCSANVFFLLSSPAYVSSPSLARALSRSLSSHGHNSLQNSTDPTSSFSKSVYLSVCRGPETHITFNKIVPPNSKVQKLFRTSNFYFLLLLLRPFPRSNCRRSLLLTFTFTSVSAQQLSSSMGEVFFGLDGG